MSKEKAIENFMQGYNCSQAIACAYSEYLDIMNEEDIFRLSEGFGGGFGGSGGVCGAISGATMIISAHTTKALGLENSTKKDTYQNVKKLMARFRLQNEYITCKDILEHKDIRLKDGKKLACLEAVEAACDALEEIMHD